MDIEILMEEVKETKIIQARNKIMEKEAEEYEALSLNSKLVLRNRIRD